MSFRREDRVLISDASDIRAVAVSARLAFAVTDDALTIYDRQFDAWQPPVPIPATLAGGRISIMAADPVEDAVWIGAFGSVIYYRPTTDMQWSALVPGQVDAILFDQRDPSSGAYVRSGGGWSLVSRAGIATPVSASQLPPAGARIRAPSASEILQAYPMLRSFGTLMTRGEDLQNYPISALARAPESEEVWVGTQGNGLFHVDPRFGNATHVPFGLLSPGAGALAMAADGIWIAGLGDDPAGADGLTFARADLQTWRWERGGTLRPLRDARAYDLAVRGHIAWVGTDRGLVRMDLENTTDARRWSATNGLPDDRVLAVAPVTGGVWVGTPRGLVLLADTSGRRSASAGDVGLTIAAGIAVRGLATAGDTLWAGTDAGLLALVASDSAPRRPSATDSRLRRPIVAVARTDSIVVAASAQEVMVLGRTGRLTTPINAAAAAPLQRITAIAADDRTIWAVGTGGVVVLARGSGVTRLLQAGSDVPAEAFDVLLEPNFAWIATRDGLLRLRRLPDGTVR